MVERASEDGWEFDKTKWVSSFQYSITRCTRGRVSLPYNWVPWWFPWRVPMHCPSVEHTSWHFLEWRPRRKTVGSLDTLALFIHHTKSKFRNIPAWSPPNKLKKSDCFRYIKLPNQRTASWANHQITFSRQLLNLSDTLCQKCHKVSMCTTFFHIIMLHPWTLLKKWITFPLYFLKELQRWEPRDYNLVFTVAGIIISSFNYMTGRKLFNRLISRYVCPIKRRPESCSSPWLTANSMCHFCNKAIMTASWKHYLVCSKGYHLSKSQLRSPEQKSEMRLH